MLSMSNRWLKINGEAIYGSRPWIHENENKYAWYTKKQENGISFINLLF